MRKLKFMAWDKGSKKFVDDVLITANKYGFLYQNWNKCEFSGEDRDIVILQYTGLKAKNGMEIYEGFIITGKDCSYPGQVVYGDGEYLVKWEEESVPLTDVFLDYEVIGNIYENPELLKKKTT